MNIFLAASASTETMASASNISFDGTITISIVLAICALFAPSITAWINNRHHYKLRTLELNYDLKKHHSDMLYKDKYEAYRSFLDNVSDYGFSDLFNNLSQRDILHCIHKVKLQCGSETLALINDFQTLVELKENRAHNPEEYTEHLTKISAAFNKELTDLLTT